MPDQNFTSDDLIWTKNVKRDGGNTWAYTEPEINVGSIFYLNWPRGHRNMGKTDAEKVKINELILIFQTVNRHSGYPAGTYLTHIVTPVEKNSATDETGSHPFKRLVTVVARAERPIPKPPEFDFREPNRGWACSLDTIKPFSRYNIEASFREKQRIFWELFNNKDPKLKQTNISAIELAGSEQSDGSLEGAEKYLVGRHKYYERDPKIIKDKKRLAEADGILFCEVCKFDFSKRYGLHGNGFIECHHKTPIAVNGERKTTVEDLALVCPNCHRMLHRKNANNDFYTVEELQEIYLSNY
jgi:hypothetical protein